MNKVDYFGRILILCSVLSVVCVLSLLYNFLRASQSYVELELIKCVGEQCMDNKQNNIHHLKLLLIMGLCYLVPLSIVYLIDCLLNLETSSGCKHWWGICERYKSVHNVRLIFHILVPVMCSLVVMQDKPPFEILWFWHCIFEVSPVADSSTTCSGLAGRPRDGINAKLFVSYGLVWLVFAPY